MRADAALPGRGRFDAGQDQIDGGGAGDGLGLRRGFRRGGELVDQMGVQLAGPHPRFAQQPLDEALIGAQARQRGVARGGLQRVQGAARSPPWAISLASIGS